MNKPLTSVLLLSAAAFLTLLLCLGLLLFRTSRHIHIGFAGPLTGTYSDLGVAGRNGAQLAIEEMNQATGLRGLTLRLQAVDDQGSNAGAKQAAERLIQSEALAVIGHMTSDQCLAALPVYEEHGKVLLSPTASTPLLSGRKDLFFRIQPATDLAARAAAGYIVDVLKLKRLCIVYDLNNEAFARPYADDFRKRAQGLGARVCKFVSFSSRERTVWENIAQELASRGPEAVFIIASARNTAGLAKHIRAEDAGCRLFSSEWARTEKLLEFGSEYVEGLTLVQLHSERAAPKRFKSFAKGYRDRFGKTANYAAAQGYNAARLLVRGLKKADLQTQDLPARLPEIKDFAGLYGPINLNPCGDFFSSIHLCRVKNGSFVYLTKISPNRK